MNTELLTLKRAVQAVYSGLTEEEWEFLQARVVIEHHAKKSFFIKEGEMQNGIGFVVSGLMRAYYINQDGQEINIRFIGEGEYATHYVALLQQVPSKYYYQCLEDCVCIRIPWTAMQEGYDKYKGFERFGRLIAENILTMLLKRIEDLQFLSAEERYIQFVKENPALYERVTLSLLASFLGVRRPSLSRIRAKLAKEGIL